MADEREVVIKIKSEYDGKGNVDAEKGLKKVEAQSKKTGETGKQAATTSGNAFETMGKKIAASLISITAIFKVINFFKESSELAAENVRAVNTLAAAYQAVGYTAQGAMKQAQDFATKMQNLTGIADEAFLNAQRLLANYGVVGTKAQEAVQAAYALSIGRSIDFASAMDLVSKAAVGQTQTLSRYGIVLGDNVKEGEKFDAVLAQINERFGATAQAAMGDTITKTNALAEAWGDFKEQIGAGLNEGLAPLLDLLTKGISALNWVFKVSSNYYGYFFDTIFIGIKQLKTNFLTLAEYALKSFTPIVKVISYLPGVGKDIKSAFEGAVQSIDTMRANSSAQGELLKQMRGSVKDIFNTEKESVEVDKEALSLNEKKVNSKRKSVELSKEELENLKKARREEEKRVQSVLNAAGVGPKQTTSGWDTSKYTDKNQMGMGSLLAGTDLNETQIFLDNIEKQKEGLEDLYNKKLELLQKGQLDAETFAAAKLELDTQYSSLTEELEAQVAKKRQATMASTLNNLASLQNSSNKKMAAVGKAAAVAQATIDTYKSANAAYSAMAGIPVIGPALAVAAAAAAIAAGLNNVAQITGVKLAEGGLVKAVSGGVNAIVGEGGSDEAVLPLDNTRAMQRIGSAIGEAGGIGGGVIININVAASGGVEAILEQLTEASRSGVVQALEFANLNYKVGQEQQGLSV